MRVVRRSGGEERKWRKGESELVMFKKMKTPSLCLPQAHQHNKTPTEKWWMDEEMNLWLYIRWVSGWVDRQFFAPKRNDCCAYLNILPHETKAH